MNQACVGKGGGLVLILAHDAAHRSRGARKLKWNEENSARDIFKDRFGSPGQPAQQITALCNDRLASHQRTFQFRDDSRTAGVPPLASIQKGDNNSGVEEDRLHWPNPRRFFLLEPRSGMPEAYRPRPTILALEGVR